MQELHECQACWLHSLSTQLTFGTVLVTPYRMHHCLIADAAHVPVALAAQPEYPTHRIMSTPVKLVAPSLMRSKHLAGVDPAACPVPVLVMVDHQGKPGVLQVARLSHTTSRKVKDMWCFSSELCLHKCSAGRRA